MNVEVELTTEGDFVVFYGNEPLGYVWQRANGNWSNLTPEYLMGLGFRTQDDAVDDLIVKAGVEEW
jgi:hypothetical protein